MSLNTPSNNGSALVIVLGFLALLTVLTLAFAMRTRTDRLSGRNYLENARANQLLHTALARAMEQLDTTFTTNYPDRLALGSDSNNDSGIPISGNINFLTEENYLPKANGLIMTDYTAEMANAKWLPVFNADRREIGRIGYIIVNTSGLLDANHAGALNALNEQTNRADGRMPSELHLSPLILSEFATDAHLVDEEGNLTPATNAAQAFIHNRDTVWKRFETLRDMITLNTSERGGAISRDIGSFGVVSVFPTNEFQGLKLTEEISEDEFATILTQNCGFSDDEAEHIIDNYFDYIDEDSIPRNLTGSSPEAVPMINEIWMENLSYDLSVKDPTNIHYDISGELYIETWFPFEDRAPPKDVYIETVAADPADGASSYTDLGSIEILDGEEFIGQSRHLTAVVTYSNVSKAVVIPLEEVGWATTDDGRFTTLRMDFDYSESLISGAPFSEEEATSATTLRFMNDEIELLIDVPVDRIEHTDLEINIAGDSGSNQGITYGCIDPRINHVFGRHWQPLDNATPNAVNDHAVWGEESELENKDNIRFHVSNQPMSSAAELGHLSTGQPWDTIRLYAASGNPDPVLDYFYTNEDMTGSVTRPGLIHISSPHTRVLATAFNGTPIGETGDFIDEQQAMLLGRNLADRPDTTSRSDVGYAVKSNLINWNQFTDARKDAIVAHSYRLFGWRDTSYTVFLAAQTGTDIDNNGLEDKEIRASQQAVVNVWRDPKTEQAAITFFGLSDTLRGSKEIEGQGWGELLRAFSPD